MDLEEENKPSLVIGLVGAIGNNLGRISEILAARLDVYQFRTKEVKVSRVCIPRLCKDMSISYTIDEEDSYYEKAKNRMDYGNRIRKKANKKDVVSLDCIKIIKEDRKNSPIEKKRGHLYIINSLKTPEEINKLREVYSNNFFLIGVNCNKSKRKQYLMDNHLLSEEQAEELISRDMNEKDDFGQHTQDSFHLSDFYIDYGTNSEKLEKDIWRIIDLIFGKPFLTPTADEFSMFMAFSASLRSADLSRQVGAVVARGEDIISTGANDVPKAGGGLYWPSMEHSDKYEISDAPRGRDYMRGEDSNHAEKEAIIDEIISLLDEDDDKRRIKDILKSSSIKDITEYGRILHAEMEALMSCARNNQTTKGATLYCTTFPCHNCAKHILAAGIKRVVYIEPYPKSKALDFHNDSITEDRKNQEGKVLFEPFVGVGPRSFYNLFSMKLGAGRDIKRKSKGKIVSWEPNTADLRMNSSYNMYCRLERVAVEELDSIIEIVCDKFH